MCGVREGGATGSVQGWREKVVRRGGASLDREGGASDQKKGGASPPPHHGGVMG
jgi:hypothetical protein